MDEESKQGTSLYDAIERGFERENAENPAPEEEVAQEAPAEEIPAEEQPIEQPVPEEAMAEEAPAPTPAPQDNGQATVQALLQMVQTLQQQNAQLQQQAQQQASVLQQQNEAAQQTADAVTSQPAFELPTLNFGELQYMDSADAEKALGEWQNAFAQQVIQQVQNNFAPIKQDYEEKRRIAANEAAKATLYGQADFADFKDNDAQIERIIGATPELQGLDPEKRYLLGGLIARGVNYQPNKQLSTEDIVKMATGNPEVMKALALQNAQVVKGKQDTIPTLTATSGLSTTNAMPEHRTKTREDLEKSINARLGL